MRESYEVSCETVCVVCCCPSNMQALTEGGGIVSHRIYRSSGGILKAMMERPQHLKNRDATYDCMTGTMERS